MNTFFASSDKKYLEERQKYIKETLIYTLSENLKECEYVYKENKPSNPLDISDATSSLCSTIEAIFLHGIKDSLLKLTLNFLDSDIDRRPNPSFWSFVCVFLHKHAIQEIQELTQVNTKIGFSRAFIRKSLNESILSSYFKNIRKNQAILKSHYQSHAFLYDYELVETVENLLLGTESYVVFNLPLNSSLLNVWNEAALNLSGIYSAPKTVPLAFGEDVAGSITIDTQVIDIPHRVTGISDIYAESISNSIFSNSPLSLDDDDRFAKIIQQVDEADDDQSEQNEAFEVKTDDDDALANIDETSTKSADDLFPSINNNINTDDGLSESVVTGNSILGKQSWSEPVQNQTEEEPMADHVNFSRSHSIRSSTDDQSFTALLNQKQKRDTCNFEEVWKKFQKTVEIKTQKNENIPNDGDDDGENVEVRNKPSEVEIQELQKMVEILCRLSNEVGLDAQGFLCNECRTLLGVDLSKANVCNFDGHYYCSSCISHDKYQIPSRIIYNWDFKNYTVSKRAATFLTDYQFKPFIDFKILNPVIYSYIDQMNRLQKLRIQLNYIRAYIFTCSETAMSELQKLLYGKEYIYESIHLYSVADLSLISNGNLEELLKRVVAVGKDHCLKCTLCSVKGFICEFCRKSRIIYPFDVDETIRCNNCGSVSHINCFDPTIPCPKCERRRKRQLLALEVTDE